MKLASAVTLLVLLAGGAAAYLLTASSQPVAPPGPAVRLVYRGQAGSSPLTPASLNTTIDIMRQRLATLVGGHARVEPVGSDEIAVLVPDAAGEAIARRQLGRTGRLSLYDWEPNVIGANGKPAPTEGTVTGDATNQGAGGETTGLLEYNAVLRAAKRPAVLHATDTTWSPSCTPQQVGNCRYGSWYLIDTAHEKMLCSGNKPICAPAETEQNLTADGYKPPKGSKPKAVRVNPGTVLVQSRAVESVAGKVTNESPNSFYVINDEPVLTGSDITNPKQGFYEGGGGVARQAYVTVGFTSHGKAVFEAITKKIAHRGQEAQLPGVSREAAQQHYAVALDGQLIAVPSIDFTTYPEGIDAANVLGLVLGGPTVASAKELASELRFGPLPLTLSLLPTTALTSPQPPGSEDVSLSLEASGPVYVCLVGESGRKFIPGEILTPGSRTPRYQARRFAITLGNNSIAMFIDGVRHGVPPSAQAIGYAITRAGGLQALPAGKLPTCR